MEWLVDWNVEKSDVAGNRVIGCFLTGFCHFFELIFEGNDL